MTDVDLSGPMFVTAAAKKREPSCFGKHWIPGYLLLGETCHYCGWEKTPVGAAAKKSAHLQKWRRVVEDRRSYLANAEARLAEIESW